MRRGVEVVVQKYLTIILAFIIILSSFSPVIVYAATTDVKQENVNAADNGEEGYITTTTINGATYKDYKQGTYNWSSGAVKSDYSLMALPGCSAAFGYVGCGLTSTAIVLSAYGKTGGIGKDSLPYKCGELENTSDTGTNTCYSVKQAFDVYKVPSTVYSKSLANAKSVIDTALKAGKPIVANVNGGGFYSPGPHYIAVLGYDENNYLVISNPCKPGIYGSTNNTPVNLDTFFNKYLGGGSGQFLIPDNPPVKPLTIYSSYSPENSTTTNERVVTITANKDIASAKGSKSGSLELE